MRRGRTLNLLEHQRHAIVRDEHLRAAERAQGQEVAVRAYVRKGAQAFGSAGNHAEVGGNEQATLLADLRVGATIWGRPKGRRHSYRADLKVGATRLLAEA